MPFESPIYDSSKRFTVGAVGLDYDQVRGEGGPHDARLVFPLTVRLHPQREEATLALTHVSCALHLSNPPLPSNRVGAVVDLPLTGGHTSTPHGGFYTFEIRLPVSQPVVARFEEHRHSAPDKAFMGTLRVGVALAWVYRTNSTYDEAMPASRRFPKDEWPFSFDAGASFLVPFWNFEPDPLAFRIPAPSWVDNVLPGLGLDRLRLIEIAAPIGGGPLPESVVSMFDDAQRDYDTGRYRECVGKCRDVRHAVEQHLGATRAQPVSDVVAAQLSLPAGAAERTFLDDAWKALGDLTNSAHHIGPAGVPAYSAAATRTCLFLTATLLDYMHHLYMPPPIGRHL